LYIKNKESELYEPIAQYAYFSENKPLEFRLGETLPGQAVKNRTVVTLSDIPENYMTIASGLGKSSTKYLVMVPLISKDEVVGLIEYATFIPVKDDTSKTLVSIAEMVADTIVKLLKK
jgi:glutamate formiminotransferase